MKLTIDVPEDLQQRLVGAARHHRRSLEEQVQAWLRQFLTGGPDWRLRPRGPQDVNWIVDAWDYNPHEVTVRRVRGRDGNERIQMRLDLGVLQMEPSGRPDGQR